MIFPDVIEVAILLYSHHGEKLRSIEPVHLRKHRGGCKSYNKMASVVKCVPPIDARDRVSFGILYRKDYNLAA